MPILAADQLHIFEGTTLAFTGHRPDKLGGYDESIDAALIQMARQVLKLARPAKVIQGMALGWDQAVAFAAIQLGIPTVAALPFKGQESVWPEHKRDRYHAILKKCSEVVVVSPGAYAASKMQVRNRWMVDKGDGLCALWDGSEGGTKNCLNYALTKPEPTTIVNVWSMWEDFQP